MTRSEAAQYLQEELEEVHKRFCKALLRVENRKRREAHMAELPKSTKVWLPTGPVAGLQLLTLNVWCMRYTVTPEFVIETILKRFKNMRRLPPAQVVEAIHLGLPANIMAGVEARRCVEERLLREFPNRENIRSRQQASAGAMPELHFETLEQMLEQYNAAVHQVHEAAQLRQRKQVAVRAYRKVNA